MISGHKTTDITMNGDNNKRGKNRGHPVDTNDDDDGDDHVDGPTEMISIIPR